MFGGTLACGAPPDRSAKKTRIDYSQPGFLRALQGHSTDCGHELSYMAAALDENAVADLQRSHGKYIYHGTDVHVVESIVAEGLLPGGGPGGRLANHFVVGPMPTQWSESRGFRRGSNAVVQCNLEVLRKSGVRLFSGADGVLLADVVPAKAIFRILAADNQRGHYTEVLVEVGSDRRLLPPSLPPHLVRDLRAEAVEATAAAMDASAAAAGSADVPASAAPAEGAEVEDADTEPSSSDSELPDTTAPAVAKAEERSGAAAAAPQERSAADVDMATDMTEAAVADPSLTVGELVDKTTQKLEYMSAYMEGASRMVGFEGALSSRAGAEHRRVLEHAEELLQKSEECLKERAAEAGAAASGAPSSGSAAPGRDARLVEGIDAFMGKDSAAKAEDQDDPMEGPSKKEESSSEELVPDDPGERELTSLLARCRVSLRRARTWRPPPATMAAYTDEAPVIPDAGATACMRARTVEKASTLRFVGSFTGQRTTGSHSRRRFFQRLRLLTSFVRTFVVSGFALTGRGFL